jgi:hypothetical protein
MIMALALIDLPAHVRVPMIMALALIDLPPIYEYR